MPYLDLAWTRLAGVKPDLTLQPLPRSFPGWSPVPSVTVAVPS